MAKHEIFTGRLSIFREEIMNEIAFLIKQSKLIGILLDNPIEYSDGGDSDGDPIELDVIHADMSFELNHQGNPIGERTALTELTTEMLIKVVEQLESGDYSGYAGE